MKKLILYLVAFALLLPSAAALAQQKMGDMKGMDMGKKPAATSQATHTAVGMVTKVDVKAGTVTVAHDPVKSLNWPAMTMGFKVTDKTLLNKLAEGKKVEFEFTQVDKHYVISAVK